MAPDAIAVKSEVTTDDPGVEPAYTTEVPSVESENISVVKCKEGIVSFEVL